MEKSERVKIFVDGNCIVCDFEISHYKRKAPDRFEIIDISHPDFQASRYNLDSARVNKHMHVMAEDQIYIGVSAFARIWEEFPQYKWAAKLIRLPGINLFARAGYEVFAFIRPWLPKKS